MNATTYLHNGQHPAMRVTAPWVAGEHMSASRVLWPEVAPGDPVCCGTCGHAFGLGEMREPYLVVERQN